MNLIEERDGLQGLLDTVAELRHERDVLRLQLKASEAEFERSESNLSNVRSTQHSQHKALRAIRAEASVSSDNKLKTAVQRIMKGLEL